MTDPTVPNQSLSRNQEDQRAAERAARAEYLASIGYQFNPETGTWQLKPKEPRQRSTASLAEVSRSSMSLPDEDYSEAVCLLLPGNHATLIEARQFEYAIKFDWQVLGRSIFCVDRWPVTYVRRRCGIGRTGYGNYRIPSSATMHQMSRLLFVAGAGDETAQRKARAEMQGRDIDHRNRNPWDNRWHNLRPATESENAYNKEPSKNKSSKYKGVSRIKGKKRWAAQIMVRGKTHYLGTFDDEFKAAQAYNAAVRKYCPEFGYVNPLSC